MTLHFNTPPMAVCLLRLSAIGDTVHALAVLRALQAAWPQTRFTWIIGALEARLMTAVVSGVEFIIFDKAASAAGLVRLRRTLAGRRFDLLLDMQLSLRASLISALVRAPVKLGFDRRRARELQWLFTNARIAPAGDEHVLDSFFGFVRACGVRPGEPRWDVRLADSARAYADRITSGGQPTLVISPCSSHRFRNWPADRYAAVADHAIDTLRMQVVLAGGPSPVEIEMGDAIVRASRGTLRNQIGQDTLPELLALLSRSAALLTPDSGPAHMATSVGLPVVGLYAATNPARSGPYHSREWCVDRYAEAAARFLKRPAAQIPWTTKIERPGVMELITVADVTERLDALMARRG